MDWKINQWREENREKRRKRKAVSRRRILRIFFLSQVFLLFLFWLKPRVWSPQWIPPCLDKEERQKIEAQIKARARTKPRVIQTQKFSRRELIPKKERYFALVKKYFPPSTWEKAYLIMAKESSFNEKAENINQDGSRDRGLFQINSKTWPEYTTFSFSQAFHPETNVRVAVRIFKSRGWKAWRAGR